MNDRGDRNRFHHVQLGAPSGGEAEARRFWVDVLGFEEIEKPAPLASRGGCWFRRSQIEIHVGIEDDFRPVTRAHPGMLIVGLDALADRLVGAGHAVTWDDLFPGMRRFFCHDPFGNRLEFLESSDP
jgi:catechol 2,3-dioxygenase-like lactoylglutathione lyase family enzyme